MSCPTAWSRNGYTAPFLNLVVNFDDGNVDSLVWDNRCYACDESTNSCIKEPKSISLPDAQGGITTVSDENVKDSRGMCGFAHNPSSDSESCTGKAYTQGATTTGGSCELRIYVSYLGNTKSGTLAKSGNLRYSRFASSTLSDAYDSFVAIE